MEKRLLTEVEASQYLGVARSFLAESRTKNSRYTSQGPPYIRAGGRFVRYDVRDLDQWIADNRRECGQAKEG